MIKHKIFLRSKMVFSILACSPICGSDAEPTFPNLFAAEKNVGREKNEGLIFMKFSETGYSALRDFQAAIVVRYESGPEVLYGFSGNFDGKIIKRFKVLSEREAVGLQRLLLDDKNLERNFDHAVVDSLIWGRGVEFTDGTSYIRIYFTIDGQYCSFTAGSGEASGLWKCSQLLKDQASVLIKRLDEQKGSP